jgi:uncharacterized protein (DUF58 family)
LIILLVSLLDLFLLPKKESIILKRIVDDVLSISLKNKVILKLKNKTKHTFLLHIKDEPPYEFKKSVKEFKLKVKPFNSIELSYFVIPPKRGEFKFQDINLRIFSLLRFWTRQLVIHSDFKVKVYPNILQIKKYNFFQKKSYFLEKGSLKNKFLNIGKEFESLREYQKDDEFSRINWKASARLGKLISEEYQQESVQNIFFAIDAGRHFKGKFFDEERINPVLNAIIITSYIASGKDDRIGLISFCDDVKNYIPLSKGKRQFYKILDVLYKIKIYPYDSDYRKAVFFLKEKLKKRSMIIFFLNLLEPLTTSQITIYLSLLSLKHLVICISMKNPELSSILSKETMVSFDVYRKAATVDVLNLQEKAVSLLKSYGIRVLNPHPQDLTSSLINKYLELKTKVSL